MTIAKVMSMSKNVERVTMVLPRCNRLRVVHGVQKMLLARNPLILSATKCAIRAQLKSNPQTTVDNIPVILWMRAITGFERM